MSVDAFADYLGVVRGTVYRWRRGESLPDEESQLKLSEADPEGHPPEWFSVSDRVVLAAALARVDGFGEAITQLRVEGFADDDALSQLEAAQDLARRLLIAQGA
jgi:transcriptional regulator with XRE-family HTH domain